MADLASRKLIFADVLKEQDFQDFSPRNVFYAIDHCPDAGVKVEHSAHWIKYDLDTDCYCSACSESVDYELRSKYCPECGARMAKAVERRRA